MRCSWGSSGMAAASSESGRPRARQDGQDLERRDDAVAAAGVLADDDVAALLAAQPGAGDEHRIEDVAVPDGRAQDLSAGGLDGPRQAAVGEDADDDRLLGQRAARQTVEGDDAQQLVAVHDPAALVDGHAAVGVAVEAEARRRRRCSATMAARAAGAVAPQPQVDVRAVRRVEVGLHGGAAGGQDGGRQARSRAVGAVDVDTQVGADGARQAQAVLQVALQLAGARRRCGRGPRWWGWSSSSARMTSVASSSSMASSSLRPRPSRTLRPLSSAGLCEAETMMPAA